MHVVSVSFSSFGPVTRNEISIFPKEFTFISYKNVFETNAILTAYKNTIFITAIGTFLGVIMTSFVAYPLSRPNFMARRFFTLCIALTLWFGAGMIPSFMVIKTLHLYNTLWAVILPALINTFHVIIMLTFFKSVPQDLIDAAKIDGCNEIRILFQIIYPLSKPILATIALWIAVAQWNIFLTPLLFLRDRALYPLQIVLREVMLEGLSDTYFSETLAGDGETMVEESIKAATLMVSTLPILLMYPFLQKYFTKGVMVGSIKG
jgi:putative aldouronate transport system permease protein